MTARALVRRPVGAALDLIRRRGRLVVWTPEWMGFGNILYVLHWVHTARAHGIPMWARSTPALTPWLPVFPEVRDLVVQPDSVRLTDRRLMPHSQQGRAALPSGLYERVKPLDPQAPFASFIASYLLPGTERVVPILPDPDPTRLVVNVRRGDYYSHPEHRAQYGFDVERYVYAALRGSMELDGPIQCIHTVSDDPDWCVNTLRLTDYADAITAAPPTDGPVENFFEVASAYRMVITNSTFSYWAAMVSNVRYGDNHARVVAPRFFDRTRNGGRSTLVDERWTIIESLPGGWDLPAGP